MGARGPKPLPANVHVLRGNPGHKTFGDLDAVTPQVEIPGCPEHLLPDARKEWERIGPELVSLGLVAKIDRAALALYCQEWAWLVWHDGCLQRDIARAAEGLVAHELEQDRLDAAAKAKNETRTRAAWMGGDGFTIPTPNGSFTYNPHWVARNKAGDKLDKFLASFGLSPSSRGRVTPSNRQPFLPGMEPANGGGWSEM
jgi:phage terminase small subunit